MWGTIFLLKTVPSARKIGDCCYIVQGSPASELWSSTGPQPVGNQTTQATGEQRKYNWFTDNVVLSKNEKCIGDFEDAEKLMEGRTYLKVKIKLRQSSKKHGKNFKPFKKALL